MQKVEKLVDDFCRRVRSARVSKNIVMYLVEESVLIMRVMYPLTVTPVTPAQVAALESRALR
jgi:hypothetical protein